MTTAKPKDVLDGGAIQYNDGKSGPERSTTHTVRASLMGMAVPEPAYDPWEHLASDFPELTVEVGDLQPGRMGVWRQRGQQQLIVLSRLLLPFEARCTLAHELVHVERGVPPQDPAGLARAERVVHEIAARRLLPLPTLAAGLQMRGIYQAAAVLWVDIPTLQTRRDCLTADERAKLRRRVGVRSGWAARATAQ